MNYYRLTYTTKSGKPTEVYMDTLDPEVIDNVMNELRLIHECTNIVAKPIVFISADEVLSNRKQS